MTDFNIQVKVDPSAAQDGIQKIQVDLENIQDVAAAVGKAVADAMSDGADSGEKAVNKHLSSIQTQLEKTQSLFRQAFAIAGIGLGIQQLIALNEEFDRANSQIRLVVNSEQALTQVSAQLGQVAAATRSTFLNTAETFRLIADTANTYGISANQIIPIVTNLNKAIQSTSPTSEQASLAVRALTNVISTGQVSFLQFRQILTNTPGVIDALGDSLGKTRSQLIQMAQDGTLSAQQLVQAFRDFSETVEKNFTNGTLTLSGAFDQLRDAFGRAISGTGPGAAAFNALAQVVAFLARNMTTVVIIIGAVVAGLAALAVVSVVSSLITGMTAAIKGLSEAMSFLVKNPIVLIAIALAALALAIPQVRAAIDDLAKSILGLGGTAPALDQIKDGAINLGDQGSRALGDLTAATAAADSAAAKARNALAGMGDGAANAVGGVNSLTSATYGLVRAMSALSPYDRAGGYQFYGDGSGLSNDHIPTPSDHPFTEGAGSVFGPALSPVTTGENGLSVTAFAGGGVAPGGRAALVGERGPELIVPQQNSLVIPNDLTRAIMASGLVSRASGGTVSAGQAALVGEQGSELVISGSNNFDSFQNVFSDSARAVSFNYAGLGSTDAIGSEYLPSSVASVGITPNTKSIHKLVDAYQSTLATALGAGQITAAQGALIKQVLADAATDWDQYQAHGPVRGVGLAADNNGMYPYFGNVRDLVGQHSYLSNFLSAVLGSDVTGDITQPKNHSLDTALKAAQSASKTGSVSSTGDPVQDYMKLTGDIAYTVATLAGFFGSDFHNVLLKPVSEPLAAKVQPNLTELGSVLSGGFTKVGGQWYQIDRRSPFTQDQLNHSPAGGLSLSSYATGGDFTVGGSGAVDSQLVQFLASPGEHVSVGHSGDGDRGGDINVALHVHGVTDVEGFRRSSTQVTAELERQLSRVRKRLAS